MSEASEGPPEAARKTKEAPAITLGETLTGIALKTLIPSAAHGREELDRYKQYKFMHTLGSVVEIAGIGMTATGQEIGPAVWVAGKLNSFLAERWALVKRRREVKKAVRLEKEGEIAYEDVPPMPAKGVEGESLIIRLPARVVGTAGKIFLPSFLSAGGIEGTRYRRLLDVARGFEVATLPALYVGEPGVAAGTYLSGRTIAVFAEAADRVMPEVKDKLKVLKEKGWPFVKRVGGGVRTGLGRAGGTLKEGVVRASSAAGPAIQELGGTIRKGVGELGKKDWESTRKKGIFKPRETETGGE